MKFYKYGSSGSCVLVSDACLPEIHESLTSANTLHFKYVIISYYLFNIYDIRNHKSRVDCGLWGRIFSLQLW